MAIIYSRLASFDWSLVESARDFGASPFRAFLTVTLPIMQPTIVGAALIALSISLDDFVITFFTIGGGNTLPTMVWGMVRTSLDPSINAIASLLILLSIGSTVLALSISKYVAEDDNLRLSEQDGARHGSGPRAWPRDRTGAFTRRAPTVIVNDREPEAVSAAIARIGERAADFSSRRSGYGRGCRRRRGARDPQGKARHSRQQCRGQCREIHP